MESLIISEQELQGLSRSNVSSTTLEKCSISVTT